MVHSGPAQKTEAATFLAIGAAAGIAGAQQLSSHGASDLALTLATLGGLLLAIGAYAWLFGITTRPRLLFKRSFVASRAVGRRVPSVQGLPPYAGTAASFATSYTTAAAYALTATGPLPPAPWQRSADFAYVEVTNEPRLGGTAADDVVARITFWDEQGAQLFPAMDGRWSASDDQPLMPQTGLRAPRITLPGNPDTPELLDIAFKYEGEDRWYAFNDENRVADPSELRHRELVPSRVLAEVRLRGSNTSAKHWFALDKCDPDEPLCIDPIAPPAWES